MAATFGISGESMHLEQKTFLKKLASVDSSTTEPVPTGATSQRQNGGSSRKRAGYQRSLRQEITAIQPKTRYDYVFIRISEEGFEREFADKITFARETVEQKSPPSALSFKKQRISSLASSQVPYNQPMITIGDESTKKDETLIFSRHQKSVRASQELATPGLFSPNNRNNPQHATNQGITTGMEDLLLISNLSQDSSVRTS